MHDAKHSRFYLPLRRPVFMFIQCKLFANLLRRLMRMPFSSLVRSLFRSRIECKNCIIKCWLNSSNFVLQITHEIHCFQGSFFSEHRLIILIGVNAPTSTSHKNNVFSTFCSIESTPNSHMKPHLFMVPLALHVY